MPVIVGAFKPEVFDAVWGVVRALLPAAGQRAGSLRGISSGAGLANPTGPWLAGWLPTTIRPSRSKTAGWARPTGAAPLARLAADRSTDRCADRCLSALSGPS